MSELINSTVRNGDVRWQLLTTVSALTLLAFVYGAEAAKAADDNDRPTVWIELGGQLERISGADETFAPSFVTKYLNAPYNVVSPLSAQRPPRQAFGGEGKISFTPDGTDWVFSAAIRYGRSNGSKHLHQQTSTRLKQKALKYTVANPQFQYQNVTRFNDATAKHGETHATVDFMAGKDVGLGMFGHGSTSVVSLGVRFAQFHSNSHIGFKSFPDPFYSTQAKVNDPGAHHHSYAATADASRSFRGIGPSISWDGATPFAGNPDAGEITFDWGANAALLFGRQKVRGNHQMSSRYFMGSAYALPPPPTSHHRSSVPMNRSHSVTVPNVGGFAGLSFKFPNAKVSLGYRADIYFGAMDGGIDSRKSVDRAFYGPFTTISIGLGD